jgi:hypothetical protein
MNKVKSSKIRELFRASMPNDLPNEDRAFEVLQNFSRTIVTQRGKVRILDKLKQILGMDTKGITMALKLAAFITVITLVAVIARGAGVLDTKKPDEQAQVTPTSTVTPSITVLPTQIATKEDIDAFSSELEETVKELESLDAELAELEKSFSSTEIDTLSKELDSLN